MNGYNFTERTRKVLSLAREEAARLHHEYVGTEHILLGLIREGQGVAVAALQNLSVDVDKLRDRIEATVKRGRASTSGPDLPYTSRAKTALELAMREARTLQHSYVGTEHLLLGLLAEQKGIAAQVLMEAGAQLESARTEIAKILGTEIPPESLSQQQPAYLQGPAPPPGAIVRVELTLHYHDGRKVAASFANTADAQGFLAWAGIRRQG